MPTILEQMAKPSVVGSEVVIKEMTDNKHYAAHISCKPLQSGESVEIRLYITVNAIEGETVKDMGTWTFPVTDDETCYVPWEPPGLKWKVTLKQIGGVTHNYNYIIYEAP